VTDPVPSKELERKLENDFARAQRRVDEVFNNGWASGAILDMVKAHYALQNFRERSVAQINAAVDERLNRVERELMEPDHPKNDWQCGFCAWMNFGSRTSCGHCEMTRPAQPPGEVQFYRVAEVPRAPSECQCHACKLWTVVYDDQCITEKIGMSWQGDSGKETAERICDLLNRASQLGGKGQ